MLRSHLNVYFECIEQIQIIWSMNKLIIRFVELDGLSTEWSVGGFMSEVNSDIQDNFVIKMILFENKQTFQCFVNPVNMNVPEGIFK